MTAVGSVFPFLEPDDAQRRAAAIEALTLDGRRLDAKVADAIQDIPFERSIEGASTVTLKLVDPDGDLLDSGLFSAAVDLELPLPGLGARAAAGLPLARGEVVGYRLGRIGPGSPILSLEFRERIVVLLTRHITPLKASRADMTRAEFIRMMVREVKAERIRFWSPELHVRQPIGKRRELTPKRTKRNRREPGFGSSTPKVKRRDATRGQIRLLEAALDTAISMGLNLRVQIGLVMAMTQESVVKNDRGNRVGATTVPITGQVLGGHLENVGVLHQDARYWPASRDVPRDVKPFLQRLRTVEKANPRKSIGWCVDEVQRSYTVGTSRQGRDYDQWEAEARETVSAYTGKDATVIQPVSTEYAKAFLFRRGEPNADPHTEPENSWTASGRLASDVNFRRFVDLGVFHFVSDDYLIRAAPRLAIKRKDLPAGVLSVTPGDFDVDKPRVNGRPPEASIRVDCYVDVLEPVIGSVWTVSGYGPLDGRYLVTNVRGSYLRPISTVTLSLPVPKLPEPAHDIGTRATADAPEVRRSTSGTNYAKAYDKGWAIHSKRYPYVWGGGHHRAGTPDGGTGRDPGIGYDCSGSVAAVLDAGGMLPRDWRNGVPDSGQMARSWGEPGQGEHLTLWANDTHVFLEFRNMTSAHKTEHFGTGDWGKGWNGAGFNPRLHFHNGFTARRWSKDNPLGRPDPSAAPQLRRPDF